MRKVGYIDPLPAGMALEEMREFLGTDTDEQQATLLQAVYERLGQAVPDEGVLPQKVRFMTMHGAKGLSSHVVFIPGLEESIIPGPWRQPYPGLVAEAARLLYVSITRARAACIISFAGKRNVFGKVVDQTHSRYAAKLGGSFTYRTNGLTEEETDRIVTDCRDVSK